MSEERLTKRQRTYLPECILHPWYISSNDMNTNVKTNFSKVLSELNDKFRKCDAHEDVSELIIQYAGYIKVDNKIYHDVQAEHSLKYGKKAYMTHVITDRPMYWFCDILRHYSCYITKNTTTLSQYRHYYAIEHEMSYNFELEEDSITYEDGKDVILTWFKQPFYCIEYVRELELNLDWRQAYYNTFK